MSNIIRLNFPIQGQPISKDEGKYLPVTVLMSMDDPDKTNNAISSDPAVSFVIPHPLGWINKHTLAQKGMFILDILAEGSQMFARPRGMKNDKVEHGGNYIVARDSRWKSLNQYPIPIYDRKER